MYRNTIIVITYNRPRKLKKTLEHLAMLSNIDVYNILIIQQEGNKQVESIIKRFMITTQNVYLNKTSYPNNSSVYKKINQNIRYGFTYAFEILKSDLAILVEDDILLGYDFLDFCVFINKKYKNNKKFKAINAFSKEPYNEDNLNFYGKYRYGIGKGWCINRNIWNKLKKYWKDGEERNYFDVIIEPWMRKGFVVMPYCSRSLDIGWGESSHNTPADKEDEYYIGMNKSWVGSRNFEIEEYIENSKLNYNWREDCYQYRRFDIFSFKRRFERYIDKLKNIIKMLIGRNR